MWLLLTTLLTLAAPSGGGEGPTLTFTGDVNFSGRTSGARPLEGIAALVEAHLAVTNAEGLLLKRAVPRYREARLDIGADPEHARLLRLFDLVGTANNHAWDAGAEGVIEHLGALRGAGLTTMGSGASAEEAYAARRYAWRDGALTADDEASAPCVSVVPATLKSNRAPRPGAAVAQYQGEQGLDALADRVRRERRRGCFVAVSIHWGREGRPRPPREVEAAGRRLRDEGAQLVVGHHPHVLQGFEWAEVDGEPRAIAWSLGNLLFTNRDPDKRRGGVLRARLAPDGRGGLRLAALELLPVTSDARTLEPRAATEVEAARHLEVLNERSAPYATRLRRAGAALRVQATR